MRSWFRRTGVQGDGFAYWPPCPDCGGPVGCVGRVPENAVPAESYKLRCNEHGHAFVRTHRELMAAQPALRRRYQARA